MNKAIGRLMLIERFASRISVHATSGMFPWCGDGGVEDVNRSAE